MAFWHSFTNTEKIVDWSNFQHCWAIKIVAEKDGLFDKYLSNVKREENENHFYTFPLTQLESEFQI